MEWDGRRETARCGCAVADGRRWGVYNAAIADGSAHARAGDACALHTHAACKVQQHARKRSASHSSSIGSMQHRNAATLQPTAARARERRGSHSAAAPLDPLPCGSTPCSEAAPTATPGTASPRPHICAHSARARPHVRWADSCVLMGGGGRADGSKGTRVLTAAAADGRIDGRADGSKGTRVLTAAGGRTEALRAVR